MTTPDPPRPRRWPAWRRPSGLPVLLTLAALTLMLLDVRGGPTETLRAAAAAVTAPIERVFGQAADPDTYRRADVDALEHQLRDVTEENLDLRRRNDALTDELAARAGAADLQRFLQQLDRPAVTARVVAGATSPAAGLALSVGSADGVRVDAAVLVPQGLVGRITAVTAHTATVALLSDPSSAVAVRLTDSRQTALAEGGGDRRSLRLAYLDPLAAVEPGAAVVTMGSPDAWPFPPGLSVGTVAAVTGALGDLHRVVTVAPAADLAGLDLVAVLTPGAAS